MNESLEQNESQSLDDLGLENEEYVLPDSETVKSAQTSSSRVIFLVLMLVIAVLGGVGLYIYLGMNQTPADSSEAPITQPTEESEVTNREVFGPSQEVLDLMQRMQNGSNGASTDEIAQMESMQTEPSKDAPTEEELKIISAMNPNTPLPNI